MTQALGLALIALIILYFVWQRRTQIGDPIVPTNPSDMVLLKHAQGSVLTRAVLPSGYRVPEAPRAGYDWVVRDQSIVCVRTPRMPLRVRFALWRARRSAKKLSRRIQADRKKQESTKSDG